MKKIHKLSMWLSIVLIIGALLSWGAFNLIGSEIDEQGYLQEPFALIPISYLLLTAGLIAAIVFLVTWLVPVMKKKSG